MDRRQLSVLIVTLTVAIASVNGQCTLDVFPTYDNARRYSEFAAGVQAIVPQYKFPCTGVVRQLTARVGTGATEGATGLELQIWRPAGNGSYNLHWGMRHPSFGETSRNGSTVTFLPQIAIPVTRGDVIGFYISTVESGENPFHLLHDPNVQGVTVYRTSEEIDEPFCNFTICADSDIIRLNNTAPLISATYESTTDIQGELVDRLSLFRVMDRCTTTSFSTCSLTPTKIVGALQTPSPSRPSRTRESVRAERPSPRVTSPIPMSTPPPSPPSPPSSPSPPSPPSPTSSSPPSPSLVAPEEPSFVPSPGTIRLTSETIVSIVIGVLLFIVLIILVVVLVACVCHKRTAVSLDNKAQLGSVDHLTVSTHLSTPRENGHRGMQAFNSTAIQEPPLDNHHCYWNVNGEGECRAPATPTPCSNRNRVMSDPVLENGSVPPARRHTACTSTTHSIRSTNPPQTSHSKVPSPARYQLTHKPLPTPPEEGGPDYTDPDGPPTLKAAHSYDKLDRYDRLGILPELEASYDMADYHEPQSLSEEMDYSASQQYAYVPTEEQRQILQLHTNGHYEIHVRKDSMAQGYDKLKFFQETDIYWAPATTTSGLYTQLSEYKYREIPRNQIRILKRIGSGHFGTVSKGAWCFCSGASLDVAVKTVRSTSEVERIKLLQEAAIMGQFAHPNVVRLHGVVTVGDPVLVVLEYMLRGDLRSFLQKIHPNNSKRELPETLPVLFIKFSKDIAAGMSYLSKKSFVHRDLAARNILLTHDLNCKIGDFGMARDIEGESDYYKSHGGIIPVKWTAPEALNYNKYTSASDVWSFGMVLFEIWSVGEKPFSDLSNPIVVALVSSKHCQAPPPGCPKPIYRLMVECWNPVHTLRPTFDSIHDYLDSPEDSLLQWRTEDTVPGKQAHVLGAPLLEANNLYFDLQRTYQKPSDGMSRGSNT